MQIFPDSNITKKFRCGERKSAYLVVFGVAPHFKSLLQQTVNEQDSYVLLFDQSLNHTTQSQQMDLLIHTWNLEEKCVELRYFDLFSWGMALQKTSWNTSTKPLRAWDWIKLFRYQWTDLTLTGNFFPVCRLRCKTSTTVSCWTLEVVCFTSCMVLSKMECLHPPGGLSSGCLDPRIMASKQDDCVKKMKRVLERLVAVNRVREDVCDDVLLQLQEFLTVTVLANRTECAELDPASSCRLDTLLQEHMAEKKVYQMLWKEVRMLLLLSHGQATVERGFSTNKQVEVENLQEQSFVAQRLVCDQVLLGASEPQGDQETACFCRQCQGKVPCSLGRDASSGVWETAKEAKVCNWSPWRPEEEKRQLEKDAEELQESADSYADKAEAVGNLTLIAQSNSLRKSAKHKRGAVAGVDMDINDQLEVLKNMWMTNLLHHDTNRVNSEVDLQYSTINLGHAHQTDSG